MVVTSIRLPSCRSARPRCGPPDARGAPRRRAGRPPSGPGEGRGRHDPAAFYWHPCRESASPLARSMTLRLHKPFANAAFSARRRCGTSHLGRHADRPLSSPIFPRIPARFCGSPPASASRRISIEPAGFPTTDRAFRRAGMDYLDQVTIVRHASWAAFEAWRRGSNARLVLFTTRAASVLSRPFEFRRGRCAAVRPRIRRRARPQSMRRPTRGS